MSRPIARRRPHAGVRTLGTWAQERRAALSDGRQGRASGAHGDVALAGAAAGATVGVLAVLTFVLADIVQYRFFPPAETVPGENQSGFWLLLGVAIEAPVVVPAVLAVMGSAVGGGARFARRWYGRCSLAQADATAALAAA